jgi:glycosyltransferase involved in cell wall biosynthesis
MRAMVINRGVQPETIQTALAFFERSSLDFYVTSSSFGKDHFILKYLKQFFPESKFTNFFLRRVIDLPETKIYRKYFFLELLARFLTFQRVSFFLRQVDGFLLKRKASKLLIQIKSDLLVSQDSLGNDVIKALQVIHSKSILTVSAAPPQVFNEIHELERSKSPDWFKYYPKHLYSRRFIRNYLKDLNSASIVTAPSSFVAEQIKRFATPQDLQVIPLGQFHENLGVTSNDIVSRKILRKPCDPLKCIYVGQVHQRKGIGYLLEGFEDADLPMGSSVTLVGGIDKKLRKYIESQFGFVKILGHKSRSELGSLYRSHDVFIFPSLIEGFSLSVIEALSSGIPVISTQIALGDLLQDKHNCLIIADRSRESISNTLEWFNSHPREIEIIRKNAIKVGNRYIWSNYRQNFISVANSLFVDSPGEVQ